MTQDLPVRKRIRLTGFAYSTPGSYFVTVCAANRRVIFDSAAAQSIVQACWDEIPNHVSSVDLGAFVVMPNHVHGIVILVDPAVGRGRGSASTLRAVDPSPSDAPSLGVIVGSFKSAVTRRIRQGDPTIGTVWQRITMST